MFFGRLCKSPLNRCTKTYKHQTIKLLQFIEYMVLQRSLYIKPPPKRYHPPRRWKIPRPSRSVPPPTFFRGVAYGFRKIVSVSRARAYTCLYFCFRCFRNDIQRAVFQPFECGSKWKQTVSTESHLAERQALVAFFSSTLPHMAVCARKRGGSKRKQTVKFASADEY